MSANHFSIHLRFNPWRVFILLLCGGAILFSTGCKKTEAVPTPEVVVQAARPSVGDISEIITAEATLAPLAQAAIAPKVTAPVKRFLVQRGARVKTGQLLATLENSDLEAAAMDNQGAYNAAEASYNNATNATVPEEYKKAELDLTQAKANLDLNQSIVTARTQLFTQGAIPGRDLDTAKAALVQSQAAFDIAKQHFDSVQKTSNKASLAAAKGQLASAKGKYMGAEAQLSYTEIRSPIDGVVTDRPMFAGETAAAGTALITVMDTSALIAKLHVAQLLAQRLTVGAAGTISVPGIDDPIAAKVALISPALDPGSTTVEVWLRVDNSKGALKPGTPVHASITGQSAKGALLIPIEAIQNARDGSRFVMVIATDGTAHSHPVSLGIQSATEAQVLSGVSAKDMVILTGGYGLDEGTKVKAGASAASGDDK
jgi:HlyD family secretion protein